jgi:hypothetical protein
MAKRKKKNNNNTKSTQQEDNKKLESQQNELKNLQLDAEIRDEDLEKVELNNDEIHQDKTTKNIEIVLKQATKLKKELETRKLDYSKKIKFLEEEKKLLEIEKKEYQEKKNELEGRLQEYNDKLKEINQLQVEEGFSSVIDRKILDEYFTNLKEQEKLLIKKLSDVTKKHGEYVDLILELDTQKMILQKAALKELTAQKSELLDEFKIKFSDKEAELLLREEELEKQIRDLSKKEKALEYDIEDFEGEREYLEEKAEKKVEEKIISFQNDIKTLNNQNRILKNEKEDLGEVLKYFGSRDPKKILDDLKDKENEIYELQEKLLLQPDKLKIDELNKLRKEKVDWESDLQDLEAKLNEYNRRYENQKLQIGEKETLVFQKEELEQRIKLQQVALDQLKEEVNLLVEQSKNSDTFVSCTQMDKDYKNFDNNLFDDTEISKTWMENLQQVIAQVTTNRLFYDLNTIRSFVAGLAMSRLSILQGISGTGKTSLPKAFAEAIGGHCEVVEVQSGWKDKQDLIGYYNTFEKKYYEGKFLKALYKATTPSYRDKPFLIILDEMNLSHPEHYFADILSLMEETDREKQILSICDKVSGKPNEMIENDGEFGLKIPNNVWFIGTANHDETTLQFAPKTYDRANIMEMPKNFINFEIKNTDKESTKVCNSLLVEAFKTNKDIDEKYISYIDEKSNFKNICNDLGIGWGNRLEKQIKQFIPIFLNLGGHQADALDHILSTKILRTIKGRYDLQENILKNMKEELEENFQNQFKKLPKKSLEIINTELVKF